MSYTRLMIFKNGEPTNGPEFRNAWGGAARIWDDLFKAHVPKRSEYDSWPVNPNDRRLWDLALRTDLPMFERAVHAFTFDLHYVSSENFSRLARDLREFAEKYPANGRVDHLPAWADWLDAHPDVEAVGLYCTSVSENIWYRQKRCPHCGSDMDDTEPVPLSQGTEVYEWLDSPETKEPTESQHEKQPQIP